MPLCRGPTTRTLQSIAIDSLTYSDQLLFQKGKATDRDFVKCHRSHLETYYILIQNFKLLRSYILDMKSNLASNLVSDLQSSILCSF